MLSTTAAYLSVATNIARQQAATAAQPEVKNDTVYYLANIGKIKTVSQFVNNYRLFSYAMKAYGLADQVYAKALMTKVLNGGVTKSTALANTLSDPRYKAFATAFNFAAKGATATAATSATSEAASRYIEQTLEDNQAKANPGVANALYFKRNASSVTSIYGLLANPTMLNVVETAYGISTTLGQTDIDTQASVLSKVVKLSDFQNPSKVEALVERYTAAYDTNNSSQVTNVLLVDPTKSGSDILDAANGVSGTPPADSVLNLFNSSTSSQNGVSSNLLLSLAKLPKGG